MKVFTYPTDVTAACIERVTHDFLAEPMSDGETVFVLARGDDGDAACTIVFDRHELAVLERAASELATKEQTR